jgi:hypothetical protein
MTVPARAALLPVALLLASASPGPRIIPLPGHPDEAIIIPLDSPVKFRRWDKYGYAEFEGRFTLSGAYTYGCWSNCADYNGPVEESDLDIRIVPDPSIAARLPRWQHRKNDMLILLKKSGHLTALIASPRQHAALRSGKLEYLRGRTTIIVEQLQAGIECDSTSFRARFVSVSKAPKLASARFNGDYGCA